MSGKIKTKKMSSRTPEELPSIVDTDKKSQDVDSSKNFIFFRDKKMFDLFLHS